MALVLGAFLKEKVLSMSLPTSQPEPTLKTVIHDVRALLVGARGMGMLVPELDADLKTMQELVVKKIELLLGDLEFLSKTDPSH